MTTYKVIRFFRDPDPEFGDSQVVSTGLTLERAQQHCRNRNSSSRTATSANAMEFTRKHGPWFDGYDEEEDNE